MSYRDSIVRLLRENRERIDMAVDKAGAMADRITSGRFAQRIESGSQRLKDRLRELDDDGPHIDPEPLGDPEPLDIDLSDVKAALPGAAGGPDTLPGEADAPIPPG